MKLALYLPNFRDKVTVSEIDDLARVAEELEFDSVWTLDRIVVPEASDRNELRKPFGFMKEFPHSLPVVARGEFLHGLPLIPYLAAKTKKVRIGVSVIDTPYRAPGVLAAEIARVGQVQDQRERHLPGHIDGRDARLPRRPSEQAEAMLPQVPLRRWGDAVKDAGGLAVFLASGNCDYLTGMPFQLDGGATMHA